MRRVLILAAVFLLPGCQPSGDSGYITGTSLVIPPSAATKSTGAFANLDPWVLTTTDVNANRRNNGVYLSSGQVGITVGATGWDETGLIFQAGLYDATENYPKTPPQRGIPMPKPLYALEPGDTGYRQRLDLRTGILTTESQERKVITFVGGEENSDVFDTHIELYKAGAKPTNGASKSEQEKKWAKNWRTADITIEGDPEAQQLVHKCLFDLWQSTYVGSDHSIAPEALSGNFYKGHIFWDAEVWMFPALVAQRPDLARSILDYRFKHLNAARALAKAQGCAGADFPWESAKSGKEVAPGGFSTGRHVTAGVGWAHWQYYLVTEDKQWLTMRGFPVISAVADYFATKATKGADGKYHINKVFGPDELKGMVDDNTYTNAMARYCLLAAGKAAKIIGKSADPQWELVAKGLNLPFDKARGVYLARSNDDGKATKQADGELVLYPASLSMDAKTAAATFDYHAPRPIKNGPAMTASIHALLAARLGRAGQAEEFFRESYRPFVRGAFLLFSEKRSLDRCVFTTGIGGVLQSVLYGFGGVDYENWDTFVKKPVTMPASWKKLTIRGLVHGGKRFTLVVTPQGRTLTPEN